MTNKKSNENNTKEDNRMKVLLTIFVFSFFGAVFIGCDSGGNGGGGFVPTGDILAVAERAGQNQTIKVGGTADRYCREAQLRLLI